LIAIFGIQDPLRPEIIHSMAMCAQAGINVRMVTGDNIDTAIAIAKKANILPEAATFGNACMEGKDFRAAVGGLVDELNERGEKIQRLENMDTFEKIQSELRVLARSSP
jgi:Ca2+ transporting ATPase